MIPAPPHIARQGPEPFLQGSDKTIHGPGFTHYRSDLSGSLGQHANFILAENARLDGLHDQNALENAPVDQGDSQKRLVGFLACLLEILEPGMAFRLADGNGSHLFGH